jgi:sialic acid synthase SpsE
MKPDSILEIDGKEIGLSFPTYFIADIAANHDGDLERAKDLIWQAKDAGADAAKFQHFKAETIVSDIGFKSLSNLRSHQTKWNSSVYEVYKAASINLDWNRELKETCVKAGISFFTSPYDFDLVDGIDTYVPAYKIGSGDITWLEILKYIAHKNKPYILATGASSLDEVVRAVESVLPINKKIALLQCNTNYTGDLENMRHVQLRVLNTYSHVFPGVVLGLSDHTPGHSSVLGAIALGARIIEKHFTDSNQRPGPDHAFSMDPKSWREMINRSRELESALGTGLKRVEKNEMETSILQRRSIRLRRNMLAGSMLSRDDLEVLRPCPADAISPADIDKVIGKRLRHELGQGQYLKYSDLI